MPSESETPIYWEGINGEMRASWHSREDKQNGGALIYSEQLEPKLDKFSPGIWI